jgi:hypothetical protein
MHQCPGKYEEFCARFPRITIGYSAKYVLSRHSTSRQTLTDARVPFNSLFIYMWDIEVKIYNKYSQYLITCTYCLSNSILEVRYELR